jgi:hypothetical protein
MRPPSFCIHWRFSLSPIVKRRPTATGLGCSFFIAVRRFSAGARFVYRDTARLDRRPCCRLHGVEHGDYPRMPSGRFLPPRHTLLLKFPSLGLQLRDVALQRQTLAGSRIADFTLKLIWAPEQPTMCPTRKLPRYATFRQIRGPR